MGKLKAVFFSSCVCEQPDDGKFQSLQTQLLGHTPSKRKMTRQIY